jgi:hypothetical protein
VKVARHVQTGGKLVTAGEQEKGARTNKKKGVGAFLGVK